jgi:hypothetical protein
MHRFPKCLLCKQVGHHSRDKRCPRRGDFAPPRLPSAAPVEARPPVEDADKVDAIPYTCRTRPAQGGGGKGKGKRSDTIARLVEEAGDEMPKEMCRKTGNYNLLCFCCPMPSVEEYRELYVGDVDDPLPPLVLSLGKSLIDLHTEFATRKAVGEGAVAAGQSSHPDIFHQDDELAGLITQSGARKVRDIHYGPSLEKSDWVSNIPDETPTPEDVGADLVREVDEALSAWKAVKGKGIPTLHSEMVGGRPLNLGWSRTNPFDPISVPAVVEEPSETIPNA